MPLGPSTRQQTSNLKPKAPKLATSLTPSVSLRTPINLINLPLKNKIN